MALGEIRIPQINGGVCLEDLSYKLRVNQAEKMLNLWLNDRIITKRWGQEWLNASLGAGGVLGRYDRLYKTFIIWTWTTKMYKTDPATGTTTEIGSGLTAVKGDFIEMNEILYYRNGNQYVQWDGTTFSTVVPYIPWLVYGRAPTGGGTFYQAFNRLGAGFKSTFNGDNSATVYTLPLAPLDATTVTCTVGGVTKTEGVDFTVNRTTGVVSFTAAPATGVDNVSITAYKTTAAAIATVINCTFATVFGGESSGTLGGSRMFISGNTNFKNYVFYSWLLDPTYFPDPNYLLIGSNDDMVTQFGKQYDIMVGFKARKMYRIDYTFDGSTSTFPIKLISDSIGCDMPGTIQLINNRLTWFNTYLGGFTLNSTQLIDERNIQPISQNINGTSINPGLMAETTANKILASSMDFQNKYWICIGSKVWVWDYGLAPYVDSGNADEDQRRLSWFPFDNINAVAFIFNESTAYCFDRTVGRIVKFNESKNDFTSTAINGYWKSKAFDMSEGSLQADPSWLKTVLGGWFTGRTDTYSKYKITVFTDMITSTVLPIEPVIGTFNWNAFTWDTFTWEVMNIGKTKPIRFRSRKIIFFAIQFENNTLDQDLALSDLVLSYNVLRKVKK